MIKMLRPTLRTVDLRIAKPAEKKGDPFYKAAPWRHFIADIIRERGRKCEDPDHDGSRNVTDKIYGDHVEELKDGGAPYDPGNIMLRCGSCHIRKTIAARNERMRRKY